MDKRRERVITYDRENGASEEKEERIVIIASEISCGCEEDEDGGKGGCEEQLKRNDDVNLSYESPS